MRFGDVLNASNRDSNQEFLRKKTEQEGEVAEQLSARFRETIGANYSKIPNKFRFQSNIPGVDVELYNLKKGDAVEEKLFGTIFYPEINQGNKNEPTSKRFVTVSINKEGSFVFDKFPDALKNITTPNQIFAEIIKVVERSDLNFWAKAKLPNVSPDLIMKGEGDEEPKKNVPAYIDLARQEFFQNMKGMILKGMFDEEKGYTDYYHLFLMNNALIMENFKTKNALFIFPTGELTDQERISDEAAKKIVESKYVTEIFRLFPSKREWEAYGALRVTHQGDWQTNATKKIKELYDKHLEDMKNGKKPLFTAEGDLIA